jgi:23S rRNA pseudouridine2605 synthase
MPVGRLDMASEGLLLFTNDSSWAADLTNPANKIIKVYHVQVTGVPDERLLQDIAGGSKSGSDFLAPRRISLLRHGTRTSWLKIELDEGKNRHIRRLIAPLSLEVIRLIRIAIGDLQLGSLTKGQYRELTAAEVKGLRVP